MSLNQAFQTAVAYRQGMIDRNMAAAAQTPMLAVQALSVGLQAQAQQQDMQFKMQSMVLSTQLQIEETKTKQAMQLMEFDLKSRQLNANEQIARKQLDFERMRTDASVAASDMQRAVAKAQLDKDLGMQVADTALSQLRSVYTNRQIYSGAADQDIQMLGEKNPVAANLLREKLIAEKRNEAAPVLSQIDQLERRRADRLREDTRGMTYREATLARQRINADFDAALAPLREDATLLTGRNLVIPSQTSLADLLTGSPGIPMKDGVAILAEVRARRDSIGPRTPETEAAHQELDQLDQTTYERMGMVRPKALEGPPKQTPLQAALAEATAAQAKLQSKSNQSKDPKTLVEERATAARLANLDAWEGTVGKDLVPTIESVRDNSNDPEQVAEAQKLRNILDAAMEATRRGITGTRKRDWTGVNDGATAQRELAPSEPRPYPVFGGPGVQAPPMQPAASTTVRSFTRAELDSLTKDPSYENVKRILSRLEVR